MKVKIVFYVATLIGSIFLFGCTPNPPVVVKVYESPKGVIVESNSDRVLSESVLNNSVNNQPTINGSIKYSLMFANGYSDDRLAKIYQQLYGNVFIKSVRKSTHTNPKLSSLELILFNSEREKIRMYLIENNPWIDDVTIDSEGHIFIVTAS